MQDANTEERVENGPAAASLSLVATGVIARTRESARQQIQQPPTTSRMPPRRKGIHSEQGTTQRVGTNGSGDDQEEIDLAFLSSPRYANEAIVRELQARPPVDFVVQNHAKASEVMAPTQPVALKAMPPSSKRQSWFSPVHVPLAHRKLVESPRVFRDILPTTDAVKRSSVLQSNQAAGSADRPVNAVPRVANLSLRGGGIHREDKRRRTVDRIFIEKMRAQNEELYDRLVRRFRAMRRLDSVDTSGAHPADDTTRAKGLSKVKEDHDNLANINTVEDAVLFFLHEKHKYDILYFKGRVDASQGVDHPQSGVALSLSIASSALAKADASSQYMPYDLERVASPGSDSSDYFIMSPTALVRHGSGDDGATAGEVIPIAQWVMESKMFSLLLAGIPLFQKFLLRKVFVAWVLESRRLIFFSIRKRIGRTLPLSRRSFASAMLSSLQVLRRVQSIQATTLPVKHVAAASLSTLQDHHKAHLADTETRLIDAKEELLAVIDAMVHEIQLNTDPSTQLDELYSVEMSTIHEINPKWKSAPIKAFRNRKESLTRQIETARHDLDLLDKYVRIMEYMFSESIYLMILGCVRHLTADLQSEDNLGAISAAVAIVGDELVLSPSVVETKNVLLEGIARLIRLAGNFYFSKNAVTWSMNRGTGALLAVASTFQSDSIATQFDLQEVLRHDPVFQVVSADLISEVVSCFNDAGHQMRAFESLKPIYAAVQSVSRTETLKNLQTSSSRYVRADVAVSELPSVIGASGSELARYLRSLSHRLAVLDKSQHACQKIQSSWRVGFLEIQCRRSITEILELITQEREMLHQHVFDLASQGTNACIVAIQKASLVFEDRPQLIEYFCEQLKLVKALKDQEKQLHQDIRNVDEVVRALKRYAPVLMNEGSVQYNVLHSMLGKYGTLTLSHDKFVAKILPTITQQVSSALQRYTVRCQKLLRLYDEHSTISTEEELEKNVGTFQDITKEIKTIEDATRLYQDYQRMVGMKVTEIMSLAEAKARWGEVESVVAFLIQWKTVIKLMENGIFSDQPWRSHLEKVNMFFTRISAMQQDRSKLFASKMLEKLRVGIVDYQRRLELVIEMAQPFIKPHHWQQIFTLLDIINFVSPTSVIISDGSTLTLGFLQTRSVWKFEGHIREIINKARHDAVTENKMEEMKKRLYASLIPIIKVGDVYELDTAGAFRLLTQFETDLLTVQVLAQLTSSPQLASSLALWAEEISIYQEILDNWIGVQADWKRLSLIFGHHDVQQVVVNATYEFQALDRKWRAMMTAAKGASCVAICLTEVMSRAFLNNCTVGSDKLWKELGNYLYDKRQFFPRLQFVSDRDLLHIIASSKHPVRLSRLISKCFREIHSLKIERVDTARYERRETVSAVDIIATSVDSTHTDDIGSIGEEKAVQIFDIYGIIGHSDAEELLINPLRVSSSPEIWMKDLHQRIQDAVRDEVCATMDSSLVNLYESHFVDLNRAHRTPLHTSRGMAESIDEEGVELLSLSRSWMSHPLHVIVLCLNVMLTNELTVLVLVDRSGPEWSVFWDGFSTKKEQLSVFLRSRDLTARERLVISTVLVVLWNKTSSISELYKEDIVSVSTNASSLAHREDTTAIYYNYANGCSFAWTKMMRFYYEPFDKKTIIHQTVKSYEYANSFISGASVPVMTPLCDRVVLALNVALSVEVGAIVYNSLRSQSCGKRTLLKELATSVGCELLPVACSTGVSYTQFHRVFLGAIQSQSVWATFVGLECHTNMEMLRVIARELGRLKDALHSGQSDSFCIDGLTVSIANVQIGIFVCAALDIHGNQDHQELMLRLSHTLMPVVCPPPDLSRVAEVMFVVNGMRECSPLSRKLGALVQFMNHSPVKCMNSTVALQSVLYAIRAAAARHRRYPFQSEERCLTLALWERVGSNVIPEQRLAVIKVVKSLFPCAEDLQLTSLSLLATKTTQHQPSSKEVPSPPATSEDLEYDSDEEDQHQELLHFRDRARHFMETRKHLVPMDQYVRKLIDLYQVVSREVLTLLVGPSGSGKSTALDILGAVFLQSNEQSPSDHVSLRHSDIKIVRLFPSAFTFKDIYGHFKEDATWSDGFITKIIKHEADDRTPNRTQVSDHTERPCKARRRSIVASQQRRPVDHTPWLVLDGISDATVLEPLKDSITAGPTAAKLVQLPNGDQHHVENELLRLFCEVEALDHWSPGSLSRCGIVYFQSDFVPYTVLIKSWGQRLKQQKPKMADLAATMVKHSRSMLPPLLEVCKCHWRPFMELVVPHLVSNFLQVLGCLVDQMPVEPSAKQGVQDRSFQAKIVLAYAALMSMGLAIRRKGRSQFHDVVLTLVPELRDYVGPEFFSTSGRTVFDLSVRFENEDMHVQVFDVPQPSLIEDYASWNCHGTRCQPMSRRMSNSHGAHTSGLLGLGTSPTLFIPTPQLLGYREWMASMLSAKLNVLVVGDSAIGKTRLMEDVVTELMKPDNRFDAKCIQMNDSVESSDVLSVVESGLPRKMRALYCPSAGKRGLIIAIENLNLETQECAPTGTVRPCSEMIRQLCDAKGSFVKSSKEFVEFRDVVLAASFSLSAYGYPRLPARLLRHFQIISMTDPTRDIFRTLLATFPEQLMTRLQSTQYQVSDISRLCRLPIEIFSAVRRKLRPSPQAPHLLLSLNDVLRCLIRLANVTPKSIKSLQDLELFTVFTTYQLFRSRMMSASEVTTLQTIGIDTTRKLGFSAAAIDVITNPFEHLYADYGDNEGSVRITARAAHALFVTADERFQWYNCLATKAAPDTAHDQQQPHSTTTHVTPQGMGVSPLPLMRKASTQGIANSVLSLTTVGNVKEDAAMSPALVRRLSNSLVMSPRAAQTHGVIEKSTASSPAAIQNMLDVLSFLQSGVRHMLFCGAEPSKRRSATMIACGAQAFHFREVTSQLRFSEYVDQLKVPVMEAGLKAAHTLIYLDCDGLTKDEFQVLLHVMLQSDLPPHLYSSSDKAKILAQEHQLRTFQQAHLRRPSVSSFFDDLTSVTSTRDGVIHDRSPKKDPTMQPDVIHSPALRSVYRENLRRYLHVVLSFGQTRTMFKLVTSYPTLYYHSCVKTFRWFDRESLEAVYLECLGNCTPVQDTLARATIAADARHDLQALVVAIHEDAMKLLQRSTEEGTPSPDELGRRYGTARSRFEDFLHAFKILFVFQKTKMVELLDSLSLGSRLLERDLCEARDQLEKYADGHAQLIEAGRAVAQSSQELKECETMDRDARRSFLLDEQRCSALQTEIEHERELIQNELNKTLPEVTRATEALSQINKYHITEMKSFVNPPQLVRLVMQAVCVLLGVPPTWTEALRILADIRFLDRLRHFDKDRVDVSLIDRVKMYINHPDFSMENMKRASIASTTLCKWVLAIVSYFEVMTKVAPTRKKLSTTELQFQKIDGMVCVERQKLIDLELKLNDLRAQHALHVQHEQELQRRYESKTKWKSEVIAFQRVLDQWLSVVRKRVARVRDNLFKLVGDSAIVGATVLYASAIPHDQRVDVVTRWREMAGSHLQGRPSRTSPPTASVSMPRDHSFLKAWTLSEKTLKEEFNRAILGMEVKEEIPLTINMLLMDQIQRAGGRFPLVVDPLGRASAWLKQRGRMMSLMPASVLLQAMENDERDNNAQPSNLPIDVDHFTHNHNPIHARRAVAFNLLHRFNILAIDACDTTAAAQIEKRISHKTPLLILVDHVSECDEGVLYGLMDVVVIAKRKGGHTVIFSTPSIDKMLSWRPKIWSQLGVVDCTPTADEMDDHILTACLRHHWPALQSEYDSACEEYINERGKEEQVVGGFLECVEQISEERDALQQTYTTTADERVSITPTGFQDHEISRITRCLDEYLLVKQKRKEAKQLVLKLRERRTFFGGFASRARAFVFAEQVFFRGRPSCAGLEWDAASIAMQMEDCVREQVPALPLRVHGPLDVTRIQSSVAAAVSRITECYIRRRLIGLSSIHHRAFCLLVAIGIGIVEDHQHNGETTLSVLEFFASRRLDEWMQSDFSSKSTTTRATTPSVVQTTDPVSRLAHEIVATAFTRAIQLVTREEARSLIDAAATVKKPELRAVFKRIETEYLTKVVHDPSRLESLRASLSADMNNAPDAWRSFLSRPSVAFAAPGEDDRDEHTTEAEDAKNAMPAWLKGQCVLSRFLLCVALFNAVSLEMIDGMIVQYIGKDKTPLNVVKSLLATERELSALHTSSVRPLVLVYTPRLHASTPFSSILQNARLVGMREESILYLSPDTDLHKLRMLNDLSTSGGWVVLQDVSAARQSSKGTLRLQLQSLESESATSSTSASPPKPRRSKAALGSRPEFRLWLLETFTSSSHSQLTSARLGTLCTQFFLEFPSDVRRQYQAFLLEQHVRKQQIERQQQLVLQAQGGSVPVSPSRTASANHLIGNPSSGKRSSAAAISAPGITQLHLDQQWIQSALWIFHSIFRIQASMGSSRNEVGRWSLASCTSRALPLDLVASQYELERALRIIQLHQRQRTLASTMTAISGVGVASSLCGSSTTAEWTSIFQLASQVYTNRISHPALSSLCLNLMAACLVAPHASGWSRSSVFHQRVLTMRELVTQACQDGSIPTQPRSDIDESTLLPTSLRSRVCESARHVATSPICDTLRTPLDELINAAQTTAAKVMAKLPSKDCLTLGVQQQEHQRRRSVINAWKRHRPVDHSRSSLTLLQRTALEHLQSIEIPALEGYVRHVWGLLERISTLNNDNAASATTATSPACRDLVQLLETLKHGKVPGVWCTGASSHRLDSARYAVPSSLKQWRKWLQQTVDLCQRVMSSGSLPDSLWLPALGYAKAYLFNLRYAVAIEHDLSPDSVCFEVSTASTPLTETLSDQRAALATVQFSGLALWNATWSQEMQALQESVTSSPHSSAPGQTRPSAPALLEVLPTLTVHLTTRCTQASKPSWELADELTHPFTYWCPVFLSADSLSQLGDPIAFFLTPCIDRAGVLAACGAAIVLNSANL